MTEAAVAPALPAKVSSEMIQADTHLDLFSATSLSLTPSGPAWRLRVEAAQYCDHGWGFPCCA
jgi:hypothetical protein